MSLGKYFRSSVLDLMIKKEEKCLPCKQSCRSSMHAKQNLVPSNDVTNQVFGKSVYTILSKASDLISIYFSMEISCYGKEAFYRSVMGG